MMKINEAKLREVIVVDNNLTRLEAAMKESTGLKIPYYLKCSYLECLTLTEAIIQHWVNAIETADRDLPVVGMRRGVLSQYAGQPKGCTMDQSDAAYCAGINPIRSLMCPDASPPGTHLVLLGHTIWFNGSVNTEVASVATLIQYGLLEEDIIADIPDDIPNTGPRRFSISRWLAKRKFRALFKYAKDPSKERPRDKMWCAVLDHSNNKFPVWLGQYDAAKNYMFSAGGWFNYDEIDMWAELHPLTDMVMP
jgi:hypothetical protein